MILDETTLKLYYNERFPIKQLHRWLSTDERKLEKREISLTLRNEQYLRRIPFSTTKEFKDELLKQLPTKIDVGCIYKSCTLRSFNDIKKEIVFDIDLSDYDSVRTCCKKDNVCSNCWKFLVIGCNILKETLNYDFGYKHLLWVFSGRRGIHCWVCDTKAKTTDRNCRNAIMEYIKSLNTSLKQRSESNNLHPAQTRALRIIDDHFIEVIIKDQNVLGNSICLQKFYKRIPEEFHNHFKNEICQHKNSITRWRGFVEKFQQTLQTDKIPKYLIEEIKFHYAYPRFDEIVTKDRKHLLKCPFSPHHVTGKLSLPFLIEEMDQFNPCDAPTVQSIFKEKEAHEKFTHSVRLFEEFLNDLRDEKSIS